ncbi:MAG TPA: hypothetical protein VFF74_05815, partial [Methylophilaceae bacterium]|nr:hypothetical protein [Methylophilaceae bacterium]
MAINPKIPGWALRPFQRIAQYFRALQDPTFSRQRRALSFFKGCIVVGVLGAILLVIYTLLLIPFTPSVSDL